MKCSNCKKSDMMPATVKAACNISGVNFMGLIEGALECENCKHNLVPGPALERFELLIAQYLARRSASKEGFCFMRKALGLRAVDLGELLGVTPETISRWETGERPVPRHHFALVGGLVDDELEGTTKTEDRLRASGSVGPLPRQVDIGEVRLAPARGVAGLA